ncbi:MAG: cell division protein ZipA C-terminal FtsZ-binding domain-containing protein [Steroidobacteraceae bacterium]
MNELRWILLIAGALLIAGVYLWGLRSRQRGAPSSLRTGQGPAQYDTGRDSFEEVDDDLRLDEQSDDAPAWDAPRIEPRVSLDPELAATPAIERRGAAMRDDSSAVAAGPATAGRREPTFAGRAEPFATARTEPPMTARPEPVTPAHLDTGTESRQVAADPEAREVDDPGKDAPATDASPARPKRPQKIFAVRVSAASGAGLSGARILDALHSEGLRFGRYDIFHALHEGRPVFSVASLKDPGTFDLQAMPESEYPGVLLFTVLPGPLPAADAFDEMIAAARSFAARLDGALADDKGAPLTAHRTARLREEAIDFERATSGTA